MMKRFFLLLPLLALAACSPPARPHVTMFPDELGHQTRFVGWGAYDGDIHSDQNLFRTWRLRSFVDNDTHQVKHDIYIDVLYMVHVSHMTVQWKLFRSARDDTGAKVPLIRISKLDTTCPPNPDNVCPAHEHLSIPVPESLLRARVTKGYKTEVAARSGDVVSETITPYMIQLQLEAVDAFLHAQPLPKGTLVKKPWQEKPEALP